MRITLRQLLTITREHIYRAHNLTNRCMVCGNIFGSPAALKKHSSREQCRPSRNTSILEGVDDKTLNSLKNLKFPSGGDRVKDWELLFQLRFPDGDPMIIPSACETSIPRFGR